jgi:hypothetical protein
MMRAIVATDSAAQTAHNLAAGTDPEQLSPLVARVLIERRAQAVQARRRTYQGWHVQTRDRQAGRERDTDQRLSRDQQQPMDYGLEL